MKIVLLAAGPLFIALGLLWFGQAAGLLSGPHNAALIDVGTSVAALALQLPFCFEVSALSGSLVSPSPE